MQRISITIVSLLMLIPFSLQAISERETIATCLVLEAGSAGDKAMIAVMNVIQNRAKQDSNKYLSVIRKPFQFTCFNGLMGKRVTLERYHEIASNHCNYEKALDIVEFAFAGLLNDTTRGSTHYFSLPIEQEPFWASVGDEILVIQNMRFFNL